MPGAEAPPARYPQRLLAGVDEAGRGALAGAVVAAAVILDPAQPIAGLRDSKTLAAKRREQLAVEIRRRALGWAVARASNAEIDRINILQASLLAMQRAVAALAPQPEYVLVDGNRLPQWRYPATAIVRGDASVAVIAAASILAKVQRDSDMLLLDTDYPQYGLARHKGYPTREHRQALQRYGAAAIHRRSFGPVRALL